VRHTNLNETDIERWVHERLEAIKAKDWTQADKIREDLRIMGVTLTDKKHPQTGERITEWEFR